MAMRIWMLKWLSEIIIIFALIQMMEGHEPECPDEVKKIEEWLSEINEKEISFDKPSNISRAEIADWSADTSHEASNKLKEIPLLKKCDNTSYRLLKLYAIRGALIPKDRDKRVELEDIQNTGMMIKFLDAVSNENKSCPQRPTVYQLSLESHNNCSILKCIWESWHDDIGIEVKDGFEKMVPLLNSAAKENGHVDASVVWQLQDVENKTAEKIMETLLKDIMPLYKQLHAYVRHKLVNHYYNNENDESCGVKPKDKDPIFAHLTGNLIGHKWEDIEDLVLPYPKAHLPNFTKLMEKEKLSQNDMALKAEKFFTSLGFKPMTATFWNKSNFNASPSGSLMGCHPYTREGYEPGDYSIVMCADLSLKDFRVIHYEMARVVSLMETEGLPYKFRHDVNQIFLEGFYGSMALSVITTKHLEQIFKPADVSENDQDKKEQDINFLMRSAIYILPLIPYSFVMDKWRYDVFKGVINKNEYNSKWWEMRLKYQGIAPPSTRPSDKFDPGAIIHIALNVPYAKYFFTLIVQFQIHEALCKLSGHKGPLHQCDIYQSTIAGEKLKSLLKIGGRRPTIKLLNKLTGYEGYNASALLEYFKPLHDWLKEKKEEEGYHVGWNTN